MEVAITAIICITAVILAGIWMLAGYITKWGPLRSWKKASTNGFIYSEKTGKMIFATPKGRLNPKHLDISTVSRPETEEIVVMMVGKFDQAEFQNLL